MTLYLSNLLLLLGANGLILLVPGVNFFLIVRCALTYGKVQATLCALGISSAILLHVAFSLLSINTITYVYPNLFFYIKIIGFAYLLCISLLFFYKAFFNHSLIQSNELQVISKSSAFLNGFFVDLFNPFISIFYMGLFISLNTQHASTNEILGYIFLVAFITIIWFSMVAIFFSNDKMRKKLIERNRWIQGISGAAIFYFAVRLIITPV